MRSERPVCEVLLFHSGKCRGAKHVFFSLVSLLNLPKTFGFFLKNQEGGRPPTGEKNK